MNFLLLLTFLELVSGETFKSHYCKVIKSLPFFGTALKNAFETPNDDIPDGISAWRAKVTQIKEKVIKAFGSSHFSGLVEDLKNVKKETGMLMFHLSKHSILESKNKSDEAIMQVKAVTAARNEAQSRIKSLDDEFIYQLKVPLNQIILQLETTRVNPDDHFFADKRKEANAGVSKLRAILDIREFVREIVNTLILAQKELASLDYTAFAKGVPASQIGEAEAKAAMLYDHAKYLCQKVEEFVQLLRRMKDRVIKHVEDKSAKTIQAIAKIYSNEYHCV